MARIPVRQVQETATTELLRVAASPDAFGAGVGRAVSGMGADIGAGADRVNAFAVEMQNDQRQKDVAAGVASFDYSKRLLDRQQSAPADGKNFYNDTKNDYDAAVDAHVAGVTDPKAREALKQNLMARKPAVMSQSASFEVNTNVNANKAKADEALGVIENKVRADPSSYDQAVADGKALLATRTEVPAAQREAMGRAFEQGLAKRTFESRLANAKTPEEVQAIENDLTAKDSPWQKRMGPADFDRVLDGTRTAKKSIQTESDTRARAALDTVKERHNGMQVLDPAEMNAVDEQVRNSRNPGLQWQWAEIKSQQQIYRQYPGLTPQQYREKLEQAKTGNAAGNKFNLPTEIAGAINEASGKTGIPSTYLAGMFNKEYGARKFNAQGGAGGNEAGASSATGVAQFTKGTAVAVAKGGDGFNARLMGIDVRGKSDDEIHAMFNEPRVAMVGAALLARSNANSIQRAIGRAPSDGELYMAHFLGAGGGRSPGAIEFIRAMQQDPNQIAANVVPSAAASNRSIFYSGGSEGGSPRTVAEVYARLNGAFNGSPSRIGYVNSQAYQNLYDRQQKGLKEDMVSYGASTGRFVVGDLSDTASWQQRGNTVRQMSDYFSVPGEDVKPFTKGEAEQFTKTIKEGSADEVLGVLTQIQGLGGDVARAAAKQLGESDAVFGFAAGLVNDRGQTGVATDIIKGRKRLTDDKDVKAAVGDKDEQSNRVFADLTGRSMMGLEPRAMAAIRDAAMAHYVETHVARGGGKYGQFDKDAFGASVQAVMGGTKGAPAIDNVNGAPTVVPPGVSGREFDSALDRMTTEDYTSMSVDGNPPRFRDGSIITPAEIATEGKFRAIGGGQYQLEMADGRLAVSQMDPRGLARPFTMKIEGPELKRISQRTTSQTPMDQTVPPNDNPALQPGGVHSNFDPVTGRWLGPNGGKK